jgi:hypothetical protein
VKIGCAQTFYRIYEFLDVSLPDTFYDPRLACLLDSLKGKRGSIEPEEIQKEPEGKSNRTHSIHIALRPTGLWGRDKGNSIGQLLS